MRGNSGFTLIELILVTVIIGILAGSVVYSFKGRVTQTSESRAKSDIMMYETAIDTYALEHQDKYPKDLRTLSSGDTKYIKRYTKDPWGNDYIYQQPGKRNRDSYDLFSAGKDGQPGTADDIGNWETD